MRRSEIRNPKSKILIVEDEIISARSYAIVLKGLGFEVCSLASTGEKAIEIAENEKPDIVIMDIGLHGNMDGLEAAKKIKDRFRIPVIYVTGYFDEEIRERACVTEPYEFLLKPIQREDLKKSIELALQKHNPTAKNIHPEGDG